MKELKRIAQMVGQSYMYKKEVYKVTGFIPEEEKVRITTDKQDIVLLEDGLHHSLTLFLEVEEEEEETALVVSKPRELQINGPLSELNNILMDNIRQVQQNPEYVKQAMVVNKTVTNITNLFKAQLEFEKLQQGK